MTVLLSGQGLTKAYTARPLFTDLSLDLRVGERVGLIGPNGSGKSTLLRLLAGVDQPDAGIRMQRRGAVIAYVTQEDVFAPGVTTRDTVLAALADSAIEEHERHVRAAITLTQAGFLDAHQPAQTLSGGWRKRLALACALVRRPDLLLLDEPTNHLDLPGIVWLQRLLRDASFGYVVATHDRAFLRAVADEIIEINRAYPDGYFRTAGSYADFAGKRAAFLEAQARRQEAVANQVRRDTEWLGRKESAQRSKSSARIEDAGRRREELAELKARNAAAVGGPAGIDFVATGRQSRKLLTAVGTRKALAGRVLFAGLDLALTPGIKLGVLGANGSGKSTLLRMLAGELAPDAGTITRADGLRTVLFEQNRIGLDPAATLRHALCPNGDTVTYRGRPLHVSAWAKRFLFQAEQLEMPVGDLSGGEQARVRVAQLMLQPADLLLLDEPTNDLDIPALEVLEDSLAEFAGALVLVSHDRDLMDRLCTEVIGLDGRGGAALYSSVAQWLSAYERALSEPDRAAAPAPRPAAASNRPRKLSYREQQEYDQMEAAILAAEAVVADCQGEVERAAGAGHVALSEACHRLQEAQHAVERLYARWQELESKRGG
jgi:ATP-binding cassette subfamily F protein uup